MSPKGVKKRLTISIFSSNPYFGQSENFLIYEIKKKIVKVKMYTHIHFCIHKKLSGRFIKNLKTFGLAELG